MQQINNERSFLLIICLCIILSIIPFLFYRFSIGQYTSVIVNSIIVFLYTLIIVHIYKRINIKHSRIFLLLLTCVCIVITIVVNGPHNIYWIYPASAIAYYLFTPIISLTTSFVLCIIVLSLVYILGSIDNYILLTISSTYFITNFFSYVHSKRVRMQHVSLNKASNLTLLTNNILEMVVSSKSLSEILSFITSGFESQFPNMLCSILLVDESKKHLIIASENSLPSFYNEAINNITIAEGNGSCGTAAFRGKRIIVTDISTNSLWCDYVDLAAQANFKSCWSEPIKNANGDILGTFAIYQNMIATPSQGEIKLLEQFAHLSNIAIEKDRASKLIWQQANIDALTSIPNRNRVFNFLSEKIEQVNIAHTQLLLAFIDLDEFKYVNDHFGHAIGDKLLVCVAKRISQSVRGSDFVARLGGDEFVVIIEDSIDNKQIDVIFNSLLKTLSTPYLIDGNTINISASIGITNYSGNVNDISGLLNKADIAMYKAKKAGKNTYHQYTDA